MHPLPAWRVFTLSIRERVIVPVYLVNQLCPGQHWLLTSSRIDWPHPPRLSGSLARLLSSLCSLQVLTLSPGCSIFALLTPFSTVAHSGPPSAVAAGLSGCGPGSNCRWPHLSQQRGRLFGSRPCKVGPGHADSSVLPLCAN